LKKNRHKWTSARLMALSAISSLRDNGRSATLTTGWLCCSTVAICTSSSDLGYTRYQTM